MSLRRKSRELSVQTLYSLEFKETDEFLGKLEWINYYEEVLKEYCDYENIPMEKDICDFAIYLIDGLLKNLDKIDKAIDSHSNHWDIDRIAILDKNVLRIAVFELLFTDSPSPVIINEAIEVSKRFCSEKS
ncbi:MAG: transcription antitermination factor NusB, partial [Candidatus Cloacimonadota bacterium]|nr:transcription antitermination factor NusB [Candidatus Cloacimonadota bacterium]